MCSWDWTPWKPQEQVCNSLRGNTQGQGMCQMVRRWLGRQVHLELSLAPQERKPRRDSSCCHPGNLKTPRPFFLFLKA